MEISRKLAQDILAHMSCDISKCEECPFNDMNCAGHHTATVDALRVILEGVEHKGNVSQETPKNREPQLHESERVTQHITITVAEYHFLTRMATLLEVILADKSYSPNTALTAVRTVVQEMMQHAEAGAAQ